MAIQQRGTLQSSLPMIAKAIGGNLGVNVVIGGSRAYTDFDTIYIPALASEIDDVSAEIKLNGFLDHEAMHIRYTEQGATADISGIHHEIWNAIEDPWGEKRMGERFPGCKSNLNRLISHLTDNNELVELTDQISPPDLLCDHVDTKLRVELTGQMVLADRLVKSEALMKTVFSPAVLTRVNGLLSLVHKSLSTSDNVHIAADILRVLEDEKDKSEKEASSPSESASGDSGTDQATGQPDPGQQSASGSDKDTGTEGQRGQPDPSQPSQANAQDGQQDDGNAEKASSPLTKALESVLNANPDDMTYKGVGEKVKEAVESMANSAGAGVKVSVGEFEKRPGKSSDPAAITRVKQASAALSRRIRVMLEALYEEDEYFTRSGETLSAELTRAALNDPNIMLERDEIEMPNTAVHILIDRSTSMRQCLPTTLDSALAIACALEPIDGLNTAISLFPGATGSHCLQPIKAKTDAVRVIAGNVSQARVSGDTPTATAMWGALTHLMLQDEPRKILVIITDGEPNHDQRGAVSDLVSRAGKSGVEILGLGINSPEVHKYFPVSENIVDIHQLAPALFKMLSHSLRQLH